MDYAVRLRMMRARCNMTQRELSARTGVERSIISRLETGEIMPSPDMDANIRATLGWNASVDAALDALFEALTEDTVERSAA